MIKCKRLDVNSFINVIYYVDEFNEETKISKFTKNDFLLFLSKTASHCIQPNVKTVTFNAHTHKPSFT